MKKLSMFILLLAFCMKAFGNNWGDEYSTGYLMGQTTCEKKPASAPVSSLKAKELYLIIQTTHKAVIKGEKIILHDVLPYATAFTQRPIRKVELITLNNLLVLWNPANPNGFTKNPPNAAINAFIEGADSKEHVNFFVQLLEPKYDSEDQTLTYRFKALDGSPTQIPQNATLGHVNLFIDDICLDCWWPNGR